MTMNDSNNGRGAGVLRKGQKQLTHETRLYRSTIHKSKPNGPWSQLDLHHFPVAHMTLKKKKKKGYFFVVFCSCLYPQRSLCVWIKTYNETDFVLFPKHHFWLRKRRRKGSLLVCHSFHLYCPDRHCGKKEALSKTMGESSPPQTPRSDWIPVICKQSWVSYSKVMVSRKCASHHRVIDTKKENVLPFTKVKKGITHLTITLNHP